MERWYRIFVSSTYEDLKTERDKVMHTLLKMNCIPLGMEYFPSSGEQQWEIIKRCIDSCDYYLVIIGGRYGSINKDGIGGSEYKGLSYTEMEYMYAAKKEKTIITCVHTNPESRLEWKSSTHKRKLAAFKRNVLSRMAVSWSNSDDLCTNITTSLHQTFRISPQDGLMTKSAYHHIMKEQDVTIFAQREEIDLLKDKLRVKTRENSLLVSEIGELYATMSPFVHVFTKDNDEIRMERHATILDFAFRVHSLLGLCAVEAYVTSADSKVPIKKDLFSGICDGDKIQIVALTGTNQHPPKYTASPEWKDKLRTQYAKKRLANYLNNRDK